MVTHTSDRPASSLSSTNDNKIEIDARKRVNELKFRIAFPPIVDYFLGEIYFPELQQYAYHEGHSACTRVGCRSACDSCSCRGEEAW